MAVQQQIIRADVDDTSTYLRQRGRPIILSYKEAGWALESNQHGYPGFQMCASQLKGACHARTVWRTKRKGQGYIATAYYCDTHLDPTLRVEKEERAELW